MEFSQLPSLLGHEVRLILDIGAHEGQALLTLRNLFRKARIFSFEPNPFVWGELQRSARWAGETSVYHVAVGSDTCEEVLHIPNADGYMSTQGSSLNPHFTDGRLSEFSSRYGVEELDYVKVLTPCVTIDSLKLSPDLIKIDVEGAEFDVLSGALTTLKKTRCSVFVEVRGGDGRSTKLLRDLGYQIFNIRPDGSIAAEAGGPLENQINALAIWGNSHEK